MAFFWYGRIIIILYEALNLVRNKIDSYSYKKKIGKEGFEIFASTTKESIQNDNTDHLIGPAETIKLTFLEIGRVFHLKDSLKTSEEFRKIVEDELIHIYSYYLSGAHLIMKSWDIDLKSHNSESLRKLDFIRGEINEIENKIKVIKGLD